MSAHASYAFGAVTLPNYLNRSSSVYTSWMGMTVAAGQQGIIVGTDDLWSLRTSISPQVEYRKPA